MASTYGGPKATLGERGLLRCNVRRRRQLAPYPRAVRASPLQKGTIDLASAGL